MNRRIDRIKTAARGAWRDLFIVAGMDPVHFTKQNRPCPLCGGRDRFSLIKKKEDEGVWYCRKCGAGDGIGLVMRFSRKSFPQTLEWLEAVLNLSPCMPDAEELERRTQRSVQMRKARAAELHRKTSLEEIWKAAAPLDQLGSGNPAIEYLKSRGLESCFKTSELRYAAQLPYWDADDRKFQEPRLFPALIARVSNASGELITLHRTFLSPEGEKAPVRAPKKLAAGAIEDGLVRLYPASNILCLAEGIETALSVHVLTGLPCWSVISLSGFQRFEKVPDGVGTIRICGDNDRSFAGASGAYELAARLKRSHPDLTVRVHIPPRAGEDWNDVLRSAGTLSFTD